MPDFNLLHLSDLHIGGNNEDPAFGRLRESLLKDIRDQVAQGRRIDAVAMTGDVVDRGGSPEAFQRAKRFFERLLADLKLDASRLLIVPGNHDIARPSTQTEGQALYALADAALAQRKEAAYAWSTYGGRFSSFTQFVESVGAKGSEFLFGGRIVEWQLAQGTVRAVLLNSAWVTQGEQDQHRLRVGRWQLEDMISAVSAKPAVLTLGLMHHPLDWLTHTEHAMAREYLTDPVKLPVDALLHGHIHTGVIDQLVNPDGALLTLVSGIGYPEGGAVRNGSPRVDSCRYALYQFDLTRGTVQVSIRVSVPNGRFVPDEALYRKGSSFRIKYREVPPPPPPEPDHRQTPDKVLPITVNLPRDFDPALIPLLRQEIERITRITPVFYRYDASSMHVYFWITRRAYASLVEAHKNGELSSGLGREVHSIQVVGPARKDAPSRSRDDFAYQDFCLELLRSVQSLNPGLRGSYRRYERGVRFFRAGTDMPYTVWFGPGAHYVEVGLYIDVQDGHANRQLLSDAVRFVSQAKNTAIKVEPNVVEDRRAVKLLTRPVPIDQRLAASSDWAISLVIAKRVQDLDRLVGSWVSAHSHSSVHVHE